MSYVLGIDLGTSSLKGLLVSEIGMSLLRLHQIIHCFLQDQDIVNKIHDWIKAIENVINDLLSEFPEMKKIERD